MYGPTNGCIQGRENVCSIDANSSLFYKNEYACIRMFRWIDEWIDKQTDGQRDMFYMTSSLTIGDENRGG